MTLNDYQKKAMRTAMEYEDQKDALAYTTMAIAGEAGEYMNIVKKLIYHGHDAGADARDAMVDELGDILWGVAFAATVLGVSLNDVASKNIEKLHRRYPDGFSRERSRNRVI